MVRGQFVLVFLALILLGTLSATSNIQITQAQTNITILPDGSIDPPHENLTKTGDTYTFTGDFLGVNLLVQSSSIVIDGAGHSIYRIWLSQVQSVTVMNVDISAGTGGISLGDCMNININHNNITGTTILAAISLSDSHHCSVSENRLTSTYGAIRLSGGNSEYNFIYGNGIRSFNTGISLMYGASDNVVCENSLVGVKSWGSIGVQIYSAESYPFSQNNNVSGNTMDSCGVGLSISPYCYGNQVHHNNFLDNTQNAACWEIAQMWDDGVEGNYWSSYTGADSDDDGIGNMPHYISTDNTDNYPLMGPVSIFNVSRPLPVSIVSNSIMQDFTYSESDSTIRFIVSPSKEGQTSGFCRLTIPHTVMSPPYAIFMNSTATSYRTEFENTELSIIYLSYQHSIHEIIIVPEYSSTIFLLLLAISSALLISAKKKIDRST
jgi:hypothetical protein